MDDREILEHIAQNGEDRILLARVYERLTGARKRNIPGYTAFLSLREQDMVRRLMGEGDFFFFGGYPDAERCIACYLPEYMERNQLYEEDSPVVCLRAAFYEKDKLTHRDFLGSLMGCGVKRESVGDICVGQGSCDFFLLRELSPYIQQNLLSAGRTKLSLGQVSLTEALIPIPETLLIRDTLASLRLDSIVSSGFRIARGQAVKYIASGLVSVDGLPTLKPDKQLSPGCLVSLRGMGKLRLARVGGLTKKGRYSVEIEKFI